MAIQFGFDRSSGGQSLDAPPPTRSISEFGIRNSEFPARRGDQSVGPCCPRPGALLRRWHPHRQRANRKGASTGRAVSNDFGKRRVQPVVTWGPKHRWRGLSRGARRQKIALNSEAPTRSNPPDHHTFQQAWRAAMRSGPPDDVDPPNATLWTGGRDSRPQSEWV